MKKYLSLLLITGLSLGAILPSVEAYTEPNRRIKKRVTQNQPRIIYIYQPTNYTSYQSKYPGCNNADIIIGGQVWASCNALDKNIGSDSRSWWFFARDSRATFAGYNGFGGRLEWLGKVTSDSNWTEGPCATGYRLPTRGEWETALYSARLNGVSLANLLNLPTNGGYRANRDTNGDIILESRYDVNGAYWTSSFEYNGGYYPTVLHLGSTYQNYRLSGTDMSYNSSNYRWQYTDIGLELVAGTSQEIANIRCIRK